MDREEMIEEIHRLLPRVSTEAVELIFELVKRLQPERRTPDA